MRINRPTHAMGINFDLYGLVAFRALADLGRVRKAARGAPVAAGIQPTHRQLERCFGVGLVEHTTRRVMLTAAGREFEHKVRALLDDLDNALLGSRSVLGTRHDVAAMDLPAGFVP